MKEKSLPVDLSFLLGRDIENDPRVTEEILEIYQQEARRLTPSTPGTATASRSCPARRR